MLEQENVLLELTTPWDVQTLIVIGPWVQFCLCDSLGYILHKRACCRHWEWTTVSDAL